MNSSHPPENRHNRFLLGLFLQIPQFSTQYFDSFPGALVQIEHTSEASSSKVISPSMIGLFFLGRATQLKVIQSYASLEMLL